MMSDAGTPKAITTAKIGMAASQLMAWGGVVGCFCNSWWCLVPGLVTQVAMFIYLGEGTVPTTKKRDRPRT